jgi:hypothetical protein
MNHLTIQSVAQRRMLQLLSDEMERKWEEAVVANLAYWAIEEQSVWAVLTLTVETVPCFCNLRLSHSVD